jgi:tartrate-resistant acid phosphatase type 5
VPIQRRVVRFVMIDTVLLSVGHDGILEGPEAAAQSEAHWAWLERTLREAGDADYLVVGGHYPVWSVGAHGPNELLVRRLRPLLIQHRVSAYVFGHDHCAQALTEGGVQYHGVGGAHLLDYGAPNMGAVPAGALAFHYGGSVWPSNLYKGTFAAISFSPRRMSVTHYDSDGLALLTLTQPPRDVARSRS